MMINIVPELLRGYKDILKRKFYIQLKKTKHLNIKKNIIDNMKTKDLLLKNKCYCLKDKKNIKLSDCNLLDCRIWKRCMKHSNERYDKNE